MCPIRRTFGRPPSTSRAEQPPARPKRPTLAVGRFHVYGVDMRRHWYVILAIVCVFTIHVQPITPYSATGAFVALLCGGFIAVVLKICSWATRRQERARLLADANHQHAAWCRGDESTALYGRFQPGPVGHVHDGFHCAPRCGEP